MISDEELQEMIETEGRDYAEPEQMIEAMATELLQLREEKRQAEEARAKSWEGAPGWAKYRARDSDWYGYYFEERPTPLAHDWRVTGRIADWASIPFESTLETRP